MKKRVAIQGEQASFHDIAAHQFFGEAAGQLELVCCDTFKQTFAALESGDADYAVCALENSLFGSINEVYDLLLSSGLNIIGEVMLRIEQCLIGLPGATVQGITEVHSHLVALAQCEAYLDATLPAADRFEAHDTAGSVALVKARNNPAIAAIASKEAAALHGMEVLAPSIETDKQNYTRFVVLSTTSNSGSNTTKTSLVFRTSHSAGALYAALGTFASRGINLTKLQSRPIMGSPWRYFFYVDVSAGAHEPRLQEALDELNAQGCEVIVFGSYPAAPEA